jgi:hypothetical protein
MLASSTAAPVLLVIAYSHGARQMLRNMSRHHAETVVDRFGRAALLADTALSGFLAVRLRTRFGDAVAIERTRPFNAHLDCRDAVRRAARAFEAREDRHVPYQVFAAGGSIPTKAEMLREPLQSEDVSPGLHG